MSSDDKPHPWLWIPGSPHVRRMRELGRYFGPPPWIPGSEEIQSALQRDVEMDLSTRVRVAEVNERLGCWAFARYNSGVGLPTDNLLRSYFLEFLNRLTKHGPHSFPTSFNIMEAFFYLSRRYLVFDLRPQVRHLLPVEDFFDWYSSAKMSVPPSILKALIPEGVIYAYNFTNDAAGYRLRTRTADYALAGFAAVRHADELSVVLIAGERIEEQESEATGDDDEWNPLAPIQGEPPDWKRNIEPSTELGPQDAFLEEYPDRRRVLVATRIDLEARRYDVRYVSIDKGASFSVITDDARIYAGTEESVAGRMGSVFSERLLRYQDLFSIVATLIFLPLFTAAEPAIVHRIKFSTFLAALDAKSAKRFRREAKKLLRPDEYSLREEVCCVLARQPTDERTQIAVAPPELEFKSEGFWKPIAPLAIGEDADGNPIVGKTWVSRTESWKAHKPSEFLLRKKPIIASGPDPGHVYIMRSPSHGQEIYKIGITRRSPRQRAGEIDATGVPLPFAVLASWFVSDCSRLEREVHERLRAYRINPRREFFKGPLSDLVSAIQALARAEDSGAGSVG